MRISWPPSPLLPLVCAVPTQYHRHCWFGFQHKIRTNRGDGLELVLRWYGAGQAPRSLGRIRGSYTWVRRGEWLPFFSRPVATWRAASRLSQSSVAVIPVPHFGYGRAALRRRWRVFATFAENFIGFRMASMRTQPHRLLVLDWAFFSVNLPCGAGLFPIPYVYAFYYTILLY